MPTVIHSCQRTGCMAAFESFGQFESYFDEILDLVEDFSSTSTVSPRIMEAVEMSGSESQSTSINVSLSVDAPVRPQHDENIIVSILTRLWQLLGYLGLGSSPLHAGYPGQLLDIQKSSRISAARYFKKRVTGSNIGCLIPDRTYSYLVYRHQRQWRHGRREAGKNDGRVLSEA